MNGSVNIGDLIKQLKELMQYQIFNSANVNSLCMFFSYIAQQAMTDIGNIKVRM